MAPSLARAIRRGCVGLATCAEEGGDRREEMTRTETNGSVGGRELVIRVLADLSRELESGRSAGWENDTLASYLEAMAGWLEDCDGFYANQGRPLPTNPWEILADALRAARIYE